MIFSVPKHFLFLILDSHFLFLFINFYFYLSFVMIFYFCNDFVKILSNFLGVGKEKAV